MAVTTAQLQQIYLAYFGRPADADGITFYTNSGMDIWQVAAAFSASPESQALYGSDLAVAINNIYNNLFNRDAEPDGLLYWMTQVSSGKLTAAGAALGILLGAQNDDLTTVNNKLAVATQFTAHIDTTPEILAYRGDAAAAVARSFVHAVTSDAATVTTAEANIDATITNIVNVGGVGKSFALTENPDNILGTSGNDTITGTIGITGLFTPGTFSALDTIDGAGGTDTLQINDVNGGNVLPGGVTVKNVEKLVVSSAGAIGDGTLANFDVSGYSVTSVSTGVVNGAVTMKAGSTQAVTVTDSTANALVKVSGGASQTVKTAGGATLSNSAGAVSVTDTKGTAATAITEGTNVSYSSTYHAAGTSGTVNIGTATAATQPTGAVTVTESITGTKAGGATGGTITVFGGTTVTVNQTAAQDLKGVAGAQFTTTQAAVDVTGGNATTSVTVTQTAAVSSKAQVDAVAGKHTVSVIQFGALAAGDTITLGNLTYTAGASGATAKEVAAAFANLGDLALNGYSSGAVSGTGADTVTFESTTNTNTAIANTGTGAVTKQTDTLGNAAVKAVAGRGGIALGTVTITDGAATNATIATVALANYGAGSSVTSDALTSLALGGKSGDMTVTNGKATSLDLSLDKLTGASNDIDLGGTYTTLKVHTSTGDSVVNSLTAGGVTALTVDGTNGLTLTDATGLSALKTVAVSGAASISADFSTLGASLTDVDASASSGANTVTIDATATKFEGGSGDDTVTIDAVPTKAISGGAGNDTLYLNVAAATFSNPSTNTNLSGFETLGLIGAASGKYDATGFSHLTVDAVSGDVEFDNVAAGADLTFTAAPGFNTTYVLKDATGKSDSLAVHINAVGDTDVGTVTAAGIESVSIDATDPDGDATTTDTMVLTATSAKTITVTGNTTFNLDVTGNTKLTLIDASGMEGGINVQAAGGVASVIKGGASANQLVASNGTLADTLIGGADNDFLVANGGLDTLTGGDGQDVFVIQTATANVNTYSTITDGQAGDLIMLKDLGTETFGATKVTLASTAVFQDYANAVVAAGGDASTNAYVGWFVFGGDTYVVESLHNGNASTALVNPGTPSFQNGTDIVVKIAGVHDLAFFTDAFGAEPVVTVK